MAQKTYFWTFANFEAEEPHEMSLKKGEIVEVEQALENGWMKGKVVGFLQSENPNNIDPRNGELIGWFPSTFVLAASPRTLAAKFPATNETELEKILQQLPNQPRREVVQSADQLSNEHGKQELQGQPAQRMGLDRDNNNDLMAISPRTLAVKLIAMDETESESVLQQLSDERRNDVVLAIGQLMNDHGHSNGNVKHGDDSNRF